MPSPVIALISAVPTAVGPATGAFAAAFPEAVPWNLLDDRLLVEADIRGGLTDGLRARMRRLIDHALAEGARAVLLTCSLYGSVAHEAASRSEVPILAPDDALFESVRDEGYGRILLLSSGSAPLEDSRERLQQFLCGQALVIPVLAERAARAARDGDDEALTAALTAAIETEPQPVDAVVLGQFSLSPAAERLAERLSVPVLAGPDRAASRIRELVWEGKA